MKHEISADRSTLTIYTSARELEDSDDLEDALDPLVANSELIWVDPEDTGDLTSAPMLGILGETSTKKAGPYGAQLEGCWNGKMRYRPIMERWAFVDYMVTDPLEELKKHGTVKFTNH